MDPTSTFPPIPHPWRHIAILSAGLLFGLFVVLYVGLILLARADHNLYDQLVLVGTACALFAAGLANLLVQAFAALAEGPRRAPR
jgi:ABC-type uncharacterized transport system permease subunit